MIVYGMRLYGYSDAIPGVGHVATQFVHIWFTPLVPLKSFFVLEGEGNRGVPIPMRGKSVLSAWLRTALFFGGLACAIGGIALLADDATLPAIALLALAPLCFLGFWALRSVFARMSPERQAQLLHDAGLTASPAPQQPVANPYPYPRPYSLPAYAPPAPQQPAPEGAYAVYAPPGQRR
jgi:hypothetical protein